MREMYVVTYVYAYAATLTTPTLKQGPWTQPLNIWLTPVYCFSKRATLHLGLTRLLLKPSTALLQTSTVFTHHRWDLQRVPALRMRRISL